MTTTPLAFGPGGASTPAQRAERLADLEETAGGAWAVDYRYIARTLVASGYPDGVIRLGHEFTGGFLPWSAQGNAPAYIAAFQHVHDVRAAVSPDFRFEWVGARGTWIEYGPQGAPATSTSTSSGSTSTTGRSPPARTWRSGAPSTGRSSSTTSTSRSAGASRCPTASGPTGLWTRPSSSRRSSTGSDSLPTTGPGSLEFHAYHNMLGH